MTLALDRVIKVCVAYYALATILLHFLQPALSPVVYPLSPYVLGAGGFLMRLTFFALAGALLATGIGLWSRVAHSRSLRLGLSFIVVAACATVVAGIFPDDGLPPPTLPSTRVGWTHLVAGMVAFPCFVLGPLFLTLGLRKDPEWRARSSSLLLVVSALAASVVWFAGFAAPRNMAGLAQRILLLFLLTWLYLASQLIGRDREVRPVSRREASTRSF